MYPTKLGKTRALNKMTDRQIDRLIETCPNIQAKIFTHRTRKNSLLTAKVFGLKES